jgi:hypothetical protein
MLNAKVLAGGAQSNGLEEKKSVKVTSCWALVTHAYCGGRDQRISVQCQLTQIVCKTVSLKNPSQKRWCGSRLRLLFQSLLSKKKKKVTP